MATPILSNGESAVSQVAAALDAALEAAREEVKRSKVDKRPFNDLCYEDIQEALTTEFQGRINPNVLSNAIPSVDFTEIEPSWRGGKNSNTEARKTVTDLKRWAHVHLPGHNVESAIEQLERLFSTAWTENDEALGALSSFKRILEKRAPDILIPRPDDTCCKWADGQRTNCLDSAMLMLGRWNDRGGAIGNLHQRGRPGHPLYELATIRERLKKLYDLVDGLSDKMVTGIECIDEVAYALLQATTEEHKSKGLVQALLTVNASLYDELNVWLEDFRKIMPEEGEGDAAQVVQAGGASYE